MPGHERTVLTHRQVRFGTSWDQFTCRTMGRADSARPRAHRRRDTGRGQMLRTLCPEPRGSSLWVHQVRGSGAGREGAKMRESVMWVMLVQTRAPWTLSSLSNRATPSCSASPASLWHDQELVPNGLRRVAQMPVAEGDIGTSQGQDALQRASQQP